MLTPYTLGYLNGLEKLALSTGKVRQILLQKIHNMPRVFKGDPQVAETAIEALGKNYPKVHRAAGFTPSEFKSLPQVLKNVPEQDIKTVLGDLPKQLSERTRTWGRGLL